MQHAGRLRSPLVRVDWLAGARDLRAPIAEPTLPPGITVCTATTGDFGRMAAAMASLEFRGAALTIADIEQRYQNGDICIMAESGREIAYLSWVRFTDASMRKDRIEVPLRPGEAYMDSVYALPRFRGQGLATAVATARFRYLRERGITAVYAWVASHNTPIIGVLQRAGYRIVGRVTQFIWRLGGRVPLLNIVTVTDPSNPLADICSRHRLRTHSGVTVYRATRAL